MQFWKDFEKLLLRSPSLAIATVNEDGSPRITPIGSLFLSGVGECFYFEKLPKGLRENLDRDGRFTILIQQDSLFCWLKALFTGKFQTIPALRLKGRAGKRRQCTPEEKQCFDSRFGRFKFMKGYNILWKDMTIVRDLSVESIEPVNLRSMTKALI